MSDANLTLITADAPEVTYEVPMGGTSQFDRGAHVFADRTTTWSCVGRDVSECSDYREVLAASGLDYEVEKVPLTLADGTPVDGRVMTARRLPGGGWRTYDVVSPKYEVVQNEDAFAFVDYMGDVRFEKAGETESGMSYVIAALPEVDVLGDEFVPHVILRNGFGGNVTVQAAICPLRMVCQNQFAVAFREAGNTVRIRHVSNAESRMLEAREVLRSNAEFMGLLRTRAEGLARVTVTDADYRAVEEALFPMGGDPSEVNAYRRHKVLVAREGLRLAYEQDDNDAFRGTAWGLVNAYSDYVTHLVPEGRKSGRFENRMMNTTFRPQVNRVLDVLAGVGLAA